MIHCDGLHHVSIPVTNLDKAKQFYSEVLGLQELERPNFSFAGAWYAIGVQQLHLIVNPEAQTLRSSSVVDSRDGHFAMRISDFEAAIRHLEAKGIPVRENRDSPTGWNQIFVCDPDGNVIELNAPRK